MNSEQMREQIHAGIDHHCSSLNADPYRVQRVLAAANKERRVVVKKKLIVRFVLILMLLLATATALAITLITATDIVKNHAIPVAQQNDGSDYSNEELINLLNLAADNDIIISDRLLLAMQNGRGYSEEETIMSLLRSEFGEEYCYWSIEQKHWFGEWMMAIGFRDNNPACLPDENSVSYEEALQLASAYIMAQTGDSVEEETRWRRNISYENIPVNLECPTRDQAVSCFSNYVTEVYGWPEASPTLLETTMCEEEWKVAYEINMELTKKNADMVTESKAITQTQNGYRLTLYIGIDQDGVCHAAATQRELSAIKGKYPQWIMYFDPITLQDHAYQIVLDSTGKVISFDGQSVQTVEGSGDQIIKQYIAAYGGFRSWNYQHWAMLGNDLQEAEADSVRCKLFQQAQFRLPPTDGIISAAAADIALQSVALEHTTVRSIACCMDGDTPIWKVETITLNPEDIESGKYTAIWILEIDCITGEVREKQEFHTAFTDPMITWLPFSFFEPDGIVDAYSNG